MNYYAYESLKEAYKAFKKGEVPVGAVIVKENKIIARAHNVRQYKYSVLGHAEIECILKAERKIKDWRLDNCIMFVTLEPCDLCKTIIKESRLKQVYYLKPSNKHGKIYNNIIRTNDCKGALKEYNRLFNDFFELLRK